MIPARDDDSPQKWVHCEWCGCGFYSADEDAETYWCETCESLGRSDAGCAGCGGPLGKHGECLRCMLADDIGKDNP